MKKQERVGKIKRSVLYILLYCEGKGAKGVLKRDILKMVNQTRASELPRSNLNLALDGMEEQELIATKICEIPETGRIKHRYCELTQKGRELAEKITAEMNNQ